MRKIIEPNSQRKKRQTLNHYLGRKRGTQAKRLRLIYLIGPRVERLPVGNFFFDHCGFDSSFSLLSNESKSRISFSFISKWWWAGCKNLPIKLIARCSSVFKPSAAGTLLKSPHGWVYGVFENRWTPRYLKHLVFGSIHIFRRLQPHGVDNAKRARQQNS